MSSLFHPEFTSSQWLWTQSSGGSLFVTLHFVPSIRRVAGTHNGQEPIWQELLVQVIIILLLGNVAQRVWSPPPPWPWLAVSWVLGLRGLPYCIWDFVPSSRQLWWRPQTRCDAKWTAGTTPDRHSWFPTLQLCILERTQLRDTQCPARCKSFMQFGFSSCSNYEVSVLLLVERRL